VGESIELINDLDALLIDLPGHGLSSDISDKASLADWADVIKVTLTNLGATKINCVSGDQISALLALAIAKTIGVDCVCATNAHIPIDGDKWEAAQPDLTPDRYGSYLTKAWQVVRASQFFWPWFEAKNTNAIEFTSLEVDPGYLAIAHRSLLRARSRARLNQLLFAADKKMLVMNAPKISKWQLAPWARERSDIWRP
jgi:pimeloyl-ACP methyl ester carboxylesterase